MAIRRRGDKWVADYYDTFRKRRWKTLDTKAAAQDFEATQRAGRAIAGTLIPTVDPDVTLATYGAAWLKECAAKGRKKKSMVRYEGTLRVHLIPTLGGLRIREISRPIVRKFLLIKFSEQSRQGRIGNGRVQRTFKTLNKSTVKLMLRVISSIITSAVNDGLIATNPLRGLWKDLAIKESGAGSKKILAMDSDEAARFLSSIAQAAPHHRAMMALMMFAGLRVGEALALQAGKIDFVRRRIRVDVQLREDCPKDQDARDVDMAGDLAAILRPIVDAHTTAAGRVVSIDGAPHAAPAAARGPWLFFPGLAAAPTRNEEQNAYKALCGAFSRALRRADLPAHHTPKSLRHTFGSQLISRSVSPAYVQQQMGHASIAMTVDVYGSWLPVDAAGAIDAFASSITRGSNVVATPAETPARRSVNS
jgi:integrase